MTATRWHSVQRLLEQALEKPADERQAFLDRSVSPGDHVLRDEVQCLVRAYEKAPAFLEGNAAQFAESILPDVEIDSADCDASTIESDFAKYCGQRIGPYQLIEEIGRGGMGVVFKARRVDGDFEHEVAIKLLPEAHSKNIVRERFHQEQQVLASLNHPNIARLYDGGVTDEGQPYIVMEYVDGLSITQYCDHHNLDINERLAFVQQITASLQHAHSNLIVHRDIKPSNILATEDGTIKLLDFGIAKLLATHGQSQDLTHTGDQLLTPSFAAPEQILGQPITVGTDVYQLGIVLYELLVGQRPFRSADSFYEMARVVCNEEPACPSTQRFQIARRLASESNNAQAREDNDRRDERWFKSLKGDLDAIVLKALSKNPKHRYASMEAFGADLHAYRYALPVVARQQNTVYRTMKFAQRHALGVVTGVVFMALVFSYAITVTVQSNKIEKALNQSRIEANKSQQVVNLLTDVFKVSDPNVAGSQQMTAGQLLDQGRARLGKELEHAPQVRAQMQQVLGEIYYNLGAYDDSVELLESALVIRQQWLPPEDLAIANSLTQLAFAYIDTDQYDKAQQGLLQALEMHRVTGSESIEQAEILNVLGNVHRMQANNEQAEALFLEAIAMLRRLTDGHHIELASGLQGLAMLQLVNGDAQNAEANSREVVSIYEHTLGKDHSYYTVGLNGLGLLLAYLERYDEAELLHREALELQRRILGQQHPYIAQTHAYLGFLANRRGELEASEQNYRQALAIQQALDGHESATIARLFSQLASVLTKRGNYQEAELAIASALQIDRAIFAADSPTIGRDLAKRAALAHARGEFVAAQKDYENALAFLPLKGSRTAETQLGYATLLLERGDFANAESVALKALKIRLADLPAGHSLIVEAHEVLNTIREKNSLSSNTQL